MLVVPLGSRHHVCWPYTSRLCDTIFPVIKGPTSTMAIRAIAGRFLINRKVAVYATPFFGVRDQASSNDSNSTAINLCRWRALNAAESNIDTRLDGCVHSWFGPYSVSIPSANELKVFAPTNGQT